MTALAFVLPITSVHAQDDDETPMAREMDAAGDALKLLRRIKPTDYAAGAKAARTAHEALRRSMEYTPAQIEKMPEGAEKVKAIADARMLLGLSYVAVCELELAYLSEDQEAITAAIKKVKESRKVGHDAYNE